MPRSLGRAASPRDRSGGHDPIEGVRQGGQVGERRRPLHRARLTEPIDPHRRQTELRARLDVVEQRRGDVHVARALGSGAPEEGLPMTERRACRSRCRTRRRARRSRRRSWRSTPPAGRGRCWRGSRASSRECGARSARAGPRGTRARWATTPSSASCSPAGTARPSSSATPANVSAITWRYGMPRPSCIRGSRRM